MELLEQVRVAFIGIPDAGKSTLISSLVKHLHNKVVTPDTLMNEVRYTDGKDIYGNDDTRIAQQLSSEIKTAYCGFTNEMNYGGESRFNPSDIYVIRYEGKIGNAEIVMMGGDEIEYTSAERVLEVAGYSLVFGSGQPVYAYNNGCFYTIEDAYEKGLLSKADIYKIGAIFNPAFSSTYPSPN